MNAQSRQAHFQDKFSLAVQFDVIADADPNLLSRLLELYALNNLMPSKIVSNFFPQDDRLTVRLILADITEQKAHVLANKMRVIPLVHSVSSEFRFCAHGGPISRTD